MADGRIAFRGIVHDVRCLLSRDEYSALGVESISPNVSSAPLLREGLAKFELVLGKVQDSGSASWSDPPHHTDALRRVFSTCCRSRGSVLRRPTRCYGLCGHAQAAAVDPPRSRLGSSGSRTRAVLRRAGRGNAGACSPGFQSVEELSPTLLCDGPVQASLALALIMLGICSASIAMNS